MTTYTIGEIAERAGFPATTLRFYEDAGIIAPVGRTDAGYRLYDDGSLERLRFVAQAKRLGCSLEEIADLMTLWDRDRCAPVQRRLHDLVSDKIRTVADQRAELVALEAELRGAASSLGGAPIDGPCAPDCACMGTTTLRDPCTLDVDQRLDRFDDWRAVLTRASARVEEPDGSVRFEFDGLEHAAPLAALAAAEATCCSFFDFRITVRSGRVYLDVAAPDAPEHAAMSEVLFGSDAAGCGCC